VIAVVGDRELTVDDFLGRLGEQPELVRLRYSTLERKREFLDGLIRQELLAQEARRRGLQDDPEVKALLERMLVQRLVQQHTAGAQPSEAEARKFYDEHQSEFVRVERVRVAHHFAATPRDDKRRAAIKVEMQKLHSRLRGLTEPALSLAFREEVRKASSDLASRSLDGDLGLRSRDELEQLWGAQVADAAIALKSVSELSGLIESDKGCHLLLLLGRQPALNTSYEGSRALEELVASLKSAAKLEINEDALRKLEVAGPGGPLIPPAADGG
jgi:hypothetical protein